MDATLFSNRVEFTELGNAITLAGSDILRGEVVKVPAPNVPGNAVTFVRLFLCGDAREAYGEYYDVDFRNLANQPTWTDRVDTVGAFTCLTDLTPIFRKPISTGGGGGQVDTVVAGDAIDVDSTDPVNPIVNVKVDGVTIGFNGSNELEVPAGGGGYVVGPGSATDDHVVLFDGVTGNLIKDSGYTPGGLVIPTGFGDIDLIESSPGYWPVEIKGGLDGDGTTMQANTGSFQVNVNPKNSIEVDAAQVQLVGDAAAPGNSQYYGTDGGGTKGFHAIPAPAGAALTRVDDTNVTLTLGGTPSTALLQAASITAGWSGQLPVARGGTGAATGTAALTNLGIIRAGTTSSYATSSTSFSNVTGCQVALAANTLYDVRIYYKFSSANANSGVNVAVSATNSPNIGLFLSQQSATTNTSAHRTITANDDIGATITTITDVSTELMGVIRGVVETGVSGSVLDLRLKRGGSSASNVTILKATMVFTPI